MGTVASGGLRPEGSAAGALVTALLAVAVAAGNREGRSSTGDTMRENSNEILIAGMHMC